MLTYRFPLRGTYPREPLTNPEQVDQSEEPSQRIFTI